MDTNTFIEILSVVFSLIFLVLVIRENIWCWLFGIISSILSVILFYNFKLYSETILYIFYVIFGFYGWWNWNRAKNQEDFKVSTWNNRQHTILIGIGLSLAVLVGYLMDTKTDANNPYLDANTSVFGLIATYLEAHKVLSAWIFWIILNGVTIGLYSVRGLHIYAGLMVVYFIMSFVGYHQWKQRVAE